MLVVLVLPIIQSTVHLVVILTMNGVYLAVPVTKNLNLVQVIILLPILFLNGFLTISVKMQDSQNFNPVAVQPLAVA